MRRGEQLAVPHNRELEGVGTKCESQELLKGNPTTGSHVLEARTFLKKASFWLLKLRHLREQAVENDRPTRLGLTQKVPLSLLAVPSFDTVALSLSFPLLPSLLSV